MQIDSLCGLDHHTQVKILQVLVVLACLAALHRKMNLKYLHTSVGYATRVPDLAKEVSALVVHGFDNGLPSFDLLLAPDTRSTGIATGTL
jgi:hypothetical protein